MGTMGLDTRGRDRKRQRPSEECEQAEEKRERAENERAQAGGVPYHVVHLLLRVVDENIDARGRVVLALHSNLL